MSKVVDTSSLNDLSKQLDELTPEKRNNILYSSLVKGGQVLVNATQMQLKAKMGSAATRPVRNKKSGGAPYPPLVQGVHISTKDKAYCEVKVTILRRTGGYLHWFEKGTSLRKTDKGYNRGSISALNFFMAARQSAWNEMNDTILANIDSGLRKILK